MASPFPGAKNEHFGLVHKAGFESIQGTIEGEIDGKAGSHKQEKLPHSEVPRDNFQAEEQLQPFWVGFLQPQLQSKALASGFYPHFWL
jgi:hypothetical protein